MIVSQAHLMNLGVTGIYPKTGIMEEDLKMYLSTPPDGKCTCTHVLEL